MAIQAKNNYKDLTFQNQASFLFSPSPSPRPHGSLVALLPVAVAVTIGSHQLQHHWENH